MLRLLIPGLMGLMFLVGCGAKTESESKSETDAPKAELGEVTTGDPGTSMLDDLANDDPEANGDNQNPDENNDPEPNQPTPDTNKDDTPSTTDDTSSPKTSDEEPFIEIDKEEEDE